MKLNHKAVGLTFILKRKIIGTNHPLFTFCDCFAYFFFFKPKQAKLNFSTNEYVLTPVKH